MLKSIGLPELIILALVGFVIFKGSNLVRGSLFGLLLGAFVGFLMRPSVPLVGQLPLGIVLTRGSLLTGIDSVLRPTAEESFNYVLVGAIIGAVVLGAIAKSSKKENKAIPAIPPNNSSPIRFVGAVPEAPAVNKFCTKCGNEFSPEVQFCGICGTRR